CHPPTHDARRAAYHVFSLLGTRFGAGFVGCRQRRFCNWGFAKGHLPTAVTLRFIPEIMGQSLCVMIMTTMATALAAAETVNFDDMKTGAPPSGWTATQTGSGTA